MIKYIKNNNSIEAYINNELIGKCEYIEDNYSINIIHTHVNKKYQGQGIAKELVENVIKSTNKKIIADCSYAKKILNNKK